jgi:hypothetical protein
MTSKEGRRAVGAAVAGLVVLAVLWLAQPLFWYWSRMNWLETGAAFPSELGIEEPLYTYLEIRFCAEAVYRIDESTSLRIQRSGASYLNSLGPNREGEVFAWERVDALADNEGPNLSSRNGPSCFGGGPPNASRPGPRVAPSADGAYLARDAHGTTLIVYPDERLAYFWNQ